MGLAFRSSITNSIALNPWVNASGIGPINTGRFIGMNDGPALNDPCYAWRYMGLNISGTIVRPVPAGGNNATNVSTEMIWDNQPFYETKLGWTFGSGGNWTLMDPPENYQLPILKWQSATPAGVDAPYLNITHEVNATVIGTGGSITHSGKQIHKDGASVTFTLSGPRLYCC